MLCASYFVGVFFPLISIIELCSRRGSIPEIIVMLDSLFSFSNRELFKKEIQKIYIYIYKYHRDFFFLEGGPGKK